MSTEVASTGGLTMSTKAITDIAAVAVPIVTAVMQFMKDDHSYEVIFLSIAFLALYGYLKAMQSRQVEANARIEELKGILAQVSQQATADIATLKARYEAYMLTSNATIANLFSDVSAFAGERAIGSLTVDPNSGAFQYVKAGVPTPPGGQERRGMTPRTPLAPTLYQSDTQTAGAPGGTGTPGQ